MKLSPALPAASALATTSVVGSFALVLSRTDPAGYVLLGACILAAGVGLGVAITALVARNSVRPSSDERRL
jgi:hypothetical protein